MVDELASNYEPEHPDGYHGFGIGISFGEPDESPTPQSLDNQRVSDAYEQLSNLGIIAFPELVAACDDERYSFSGVYAAWHNHSVGDACRMIISGHVDYWGYGYKSRDCPSGGYITKPHYIGSKQGSGDLRVWWAERQNRSLRELQIESLLWTIEQEETAGFIDEEQEAMVLSPLRARLVELGYTASPEN